MFRKGCEMRPGPVGKSETAKIGSETGRKRLSGQGLEVFHLRGKGQKNTASQNRTITRETEPSVILRNGITIGVDHGST